MSLPPIPVDPQSLAMLREALEPGPDAERSSLWDLLTMWSQLGGSDTEAVEEVIVPGIMPADDPDVVLMRDPHYHPNDVILRLVDEAHAQWTSQPCEPEGALARLESRLLASHAARIVRFYKGASHE